MRFSKINAAGVFYFQQLNEAPATEFSGFKHCATHNSKPN